MQLGDRKEAVRWLLRAVAEAPHLREPYLELAERFYEEENWDGVVFLCREALKITVRPRTYICEASSWGSMPWDLLSLGLYYTGRFAEALDAAETAARISPSAGYAVRTSRPEPAGHSASAASYSSAQ